MDRRLMLFIDTPIFRNNNLELSCGYIRMLLFVIQ